MEFSRDGLRNILSNPLAHLDCKVLF
jgi:hypothetical protein